ncbi:MAG: hypothetical protein QM779_08165 [Propionicimonas sp.]|uniref:hypothetical protein n=1 Tax=Propionicimonas sp. TaxID=1955623 RepID=UPI003D11E71F
MSEAISSNVLDRLNPHQDESAATGALDVSLNASAAITNSSNRSADVVQASGSPATIATLGRRESTSRGAAVPGSLDVRGRRPRGLPSTPSSGG